MGGHVPAQVFLLNLPQTCAMMLQAHTRRTSAHSRIWLHASTIKASRPTERVSDGRIELGENLHADVGQRGRSSRPPAHQLVPPPHILAGRRRHVLRRL